MMNLLTDIIQRCHQRHKRPLRQRKTIVTPSTYKGLLYHFTVYCAHRLPVRLMDLERARISFMPTGGSPKNDRVPRSFGGERFQTRQGIEDWQIRHWHTSWGIQIYTGVPSEINGAPWHDIEFTYQAICAIPDAVLTCIETLMNVVPNPLLTITRSGGLRFSCRIPYYLHTHETDKRYSLFNEISNPEDLQKRKLYLDIRGETGYSPWDACHEILIGNLLEPPIMAKELLFTSINVLQVPLFELINSDTNNTISQSETVINSLGALGSYKLDLAKEALLKREFTYLRVENDRHHWTQHDDTDLLLWEKDNTIWIRATNQRVGLPTVDTLITDVWDDTGILPPTNDTGLPASEQLLAVREGRLSPLVIKRPKPKLKKQDIPTNYYQPLKKKLDQIEQILDDDTRISALIADNGAKNNYELETHLLRTGKVSFSGHFNVIQEAAQHFQNLNLLGIERWRNYSFRSHLLKNIPVDSRMETPFQHGSVCEDSERCILLKGKGINPSVAICPQCLVNTECKRKGYLSQPMSLKLSDTQMFGLLKKFVDPKEYTVINQTFEASNDADRIFIIDDVGTDELFLKSWVSSETLAHWAENWQGCALGNFAQALRFVLEINNDPEDQIVKRVRTVVQAFDHNEEEIVKQMRQVNVKCRVVEEKKIDDKTGSVLALYMIRFENGMATHIPIDNNAAKTLREKGLLVILPESFILNQDIKIPLFIEQAIRLGIFDISTPEAIQELPSTYLNPEWTLWHQFKRFFSHYKQDRDAPMIWNNKILQFWVPPVLNESINRLLLMSKTHSEANFQRAFPEEKIKLTRINPEPWFTGNQVFQIRSGVQSLKTILDYDSTWDVVGISKIGLRIISGICSEIVRTPKVKHAIITFRSIVPQLKGMRSRKNVCLLTQFERFNYMKSAFESAQVIWIVGTPYWEPGIIWRRAQIIYGNDDDPICYDADTQFQYYKDERVQRIFIQMVTDVISEIIGRAGLNRLPNKKVILICSQQIPNITDRPETVLFDWEDFEVAGSLEKLHETVLKRERYETERENLTADSGREKVEQVLGCSSSHANRILQKLRGTNNMHITFREQILTLLTDGEKKASEIIEAIEGNPKGIHNELVRLNNLGEITKVRWGVYALPETLTSASNT